MDKREARILIVDDNPRNIQILAKLLNDKGYQPEYAMNGAEALEWGSLEKFDLILLDIMMPDMDGFTVCTKLKNLDKNTETPVIFLTAKTDIESIKKGFQSGGVDYISKPFAFDELLARVDTQVELSISRKKLKKVNHWLEDEVKKRTEELEFLNNQLLQTNKDLRNLDKAKSEFIQLLSHEIRTPLNGIMGSLSLLKSIQVSNESKELIEILDLSVERLERFSLAALDISQLRLKGKKALQQETTCLKTIIERVLDELSEPIKEQKITTSIQTMTEKSSILNIDKNYIHKAIGNLLRNAITHSPKGGRIFIEIQSIKNSLQLIIKDEGTGFPKNIITHPFEPFTTYDRHDVNFGLGLHLTDLIMESHNGQLQIGNNKEKGAFAKLIFQNGTVNADA